MKKTDIVVVALNCSCLEKTSDERRQIIDVVVALVVALVLVYSKPLMKKTKNEIDVVVDLVLVYSEPLDLMKKTKN